MARGRPKKVKSDSNEPVQSVPVSERDLSLCFTCQRKANVYPCRAGESNQYKFCSIECFNRFNISTMEDIELADEVPVEPEVKPEAGEVEPQADEFPATDTLEPSAE